MSPRIRTALALKKRPPATETRSRKGLDREEAVLLAARRVLIEEGYTQFSLRNVAAEADMHLSNLQYYFPTRDALIKALLKHVQTGYMRKYAEKFASLPPDPLPRFVAMVDCLIEDIHSAETRRFFVQLWALLESSDRQAKMLNALYSQHVDNLASYIGEINPTLPRRVLQQRAAMIAAMIDGMMLMLEDAELYTRSGDETISMAMRRQILRIAMARPKTISGERS